jgi:hypothetical protein
MAAEDFQAYFRSRFRAPPGTAHFDSQTETELAPNQAGAR